MSSWTTVTFTIDYEDEIELRSPELQQIILGYIRNENGKAASYRTNGMNVFVKPRGVNVEEMLEDLADYLKEKLVMIKKSEERF